MRKESVQGWLQPSGEWCSVKKASSDGGGGAVATELRNECRRTLARPLHLWVGDTRRYNKQIWDKEKRSSLDCWVLAVLHWALRNAQLTGADWWLPSCYTLSQLSLCNSRCFPHTMLFLRSCVLGCIQMYFCCPPLSSAVLCCPLLSSIL